MTAIRDENATDGSRLESEFEHRPVPLSHRKPTRSVAAVWFGFPMILTCAVFGGLLCAFLGFQAAIGAILVGNLILFLYVGALSYLAGSTGLNFGLQAARVFGRIGSLVVAGFLATVVTGWFAFQTGLTGATVNQSFGWSEKPVTLIAGVLFVGITFIGIRALSWLGMVAAPFFILLAIVALVLIATGTGLSGVWNYPGLGGGMAFGAGVTLVVATFADSGTMTADFTRWSRSGREAVKATITAFPIANLASFIVGAVIVASGAISDPATNGGNFLPLLATGHGTFLTVIAFLFVFINLGSVCTHCLYNGAVGWSQMTGSRMRLMTLILGAIGTLAALTGIWSHFLDWLNVLGVFVPPIGAVIITDQLLMRRLRQDRPVATIRVTAAISYALGAIAAGIIHYQAPQFAEVVVGMIVAALSYWILGTFLDARNPTVRTARPAGVAGADQLEE